MLMDLLNCWYSVFLIAGKAHVFGNNIISVDGIVAVWCEQQQ